jgi:deoxyribonuclease-4
VLIGAHVRAGGRLVPALERGEEIGAEVVQIFTQSPRAWKPTQYGPGVLAGYRAAQEHHPAISATYCHATYLINLATADPDLLDRSRACLAANLSVARDIGAAGLVLHIGSHRGTGFATCVPQVAATLVEAIESVLGPGAVTSAGCPILLENAAGAGGTVGRSFEELAEVMARADAGEALGDCIDTQHLWASGVGFATVADADAVIAAFDATFGLDRLGCLHLNDSKVAFGANRDRHANIGEGTIGEAGLGALLGHPALQGQAANLEVPGAGQGPRAQDLDAGRHALAMGVAMRA